MEQSNHPSDPRPDKVSDHRHWKRVLHNAWHESKDLYGVIHGVRCGGAEMAETTKSYTLLPGDWRVGEWEDIKQRYLNPIKEQLVNIFKITRFALYTNEELPEGIFEEKTK